MKCYIRTQGTNIKTPLIIMNHCSDLLAILGMMRLFSKFHTYNNLTQKLCILQWYKWESKSSISMLNNYILSVKMCHCCSIYRPVKEIIFIHVYSFFKISKLICWFEWNQYCISWSEQALLSYPCKLLVGGVKNFLKRKK